MAIPVPAKWAIDGVARRVIANTLGYMGAMDGAVYTALLFALRDGDVQARITYLNPDGSLSNRRETIAADYWKADADGKAIHTPWDHDSYDGCIEIDMESVFRWLEGRKKPHRPRGTGYANVDAPLVSEARQLTQQGYTKSAAVWKVIGRDAKRAPGNGSPESKHRRLVNALGNGE